MNHHTLVLQRFTHDDKPTLGVLKHLGQPLTFVVEDRKRETKVAGDTRIPEGAYILDWRPHGRWAQRFQKMGFPGSLELREVPGFSDILIHVGNTKTDTAGCLLPNSLAYLDTRTGGSSLKACKLLYTLIYRTGGTWEISIS